VLGAQYFDLIVVDPDPNWAIDKDHFNADVRLGGRLSHMQSSLGDVDAMATQLDKNGGFCGK